MYTAKCTECDRAFDLLETVDAQEWYYGHDCEDGYAVQWPAPVSG